MNQKIITFVGLALIAVLAIGQFFTASRGFSPMENRYLEAMPDAEWDNIRSGSYMDQLEKYLADHVPGRDGWVQLKNTAVRLTGRDQIGQVVFAEDDRLIQVQDISLEQLKQNVKLISNWADQLPENVEVNFLLAPNASWVYEELVPEETPRYDPEEAERVVANGLSERVELTVPYEVLREHRDEAIYFKSDHHWTMRGAAYAYQELAADMSLSVADPFSYESVIMGTDFKGSIYSQAPVVGYPGENFEVFQTPSLTAGWSTGTEFGTVLMEEHFEKRDQYLAFFGSNYGRMQILNKAAQSEKKVLILKDSYANILLPFIIENYAEVVVADLRYYRGSQTQLVQEEAIDQVICIYNLDFLCTDSSFVWLGV